jgi:cation diffusion facilitator CzcD-associated flavoprotein CzcO
LRTEEQHLDVLIVGAGLSGIGAGCHLEMNLPGKTYALLEARDRIGGTWDLFRYPGIRSDSDMYTLGYSFKPWGKSKSIADGPDILEYVKETAREHDVERHIRYNHRAVRAEWSSDEQRWTVEAERTDTGETVRFTAGFVFMCSGYYDYSQGYSPEFPGAEQFGGQIVHPQFWPEDLDYAGKRVVVIGSGATAVTLVPAMAPEAEHVTMLQRSPTWIVSLPAVDPFAKLVRRVLPPKQAYSVVRWKNVLLTMASFQISRRRPAVMKALLRKGLERELPRGYDFDTHFKPRYDPWDQRLCLVPDGDLFKSLRRGEASIVTDTIETFTPTGIRLTSGVELEADVIVTATGLNLLAFGGLQINVDGQDISLPQTMGYKGMMLTGVPNAAAAIGYTNASWTLKCDLTCEYVCRLLAHMDERGYGSVTPVNNDLTVEPQPFIDFSSGYVLRAIDSFPKQGSKAPWRLYQNYARDIVSLRFGALEDGALQFAPAHVGSATAAEPAIAA